MSSPKSRRISLCRRKIRRGPPTVTERPGGRRCRRTGSREPTPTPFWSKLPRPPRQMHNATGKPKRRRRHHCCFRCRPPRPTNCAAPPAGWPTGCKHMTTWRCRIWPTPWRAGVGTGRCARRSSPAAREELTARLREVADGDTPYQAAVGQDDRGPVWVFSGHGSQWAAMGADLLANEPVFAATVAAGRAADRPGVGVLGDRGDDGA